MNNILVDASTDKTHNVLAADIHDDLSFGNSLKVSEVFLNDGIAQDCGVSCGWEILFGSLSSSLGDFAPYNPPNGAWYESREQALIALVAWLLKQDKESKDILIKEALSASAIGKL
jgi:hypothetical protein